MSRSIDERIVDMQFNNKQFENGIKDSLGSLKDLGKGLDDLGSGGSLSSIQSGVETLTSKFSAFGVMGIQVLKNIADEAYRVGKDIIESLTLEPIMQGFEEYELKMGSTQTIMAGSGESLETVNRYLEELNTYADRTIYSFSDMTSNIGKFTNAGVSLDKSVAAIQGISNAAALSGANSNEASRAMYNFAQALSAGHVKLIDWKSIENANMATVEFKNQLLETAVDMGVLTKTADGMYQQLFETSSGAAEAMGPIFDATVGFNEKLKDGWMTTEVLVSTLGDYADETTEIGKRAFAAAQDIKTVTQLLDTLAEAVGSGWAQTFEIIIGDFDEAKELWTQVSDAVSGVIEKQTEARNELLSGALSSGWKQLMGEGIAHSEDFQEIIKEVARDHGVAVDDMIKEAGSFEKSLNSGWLSADILSESLSKTVKELGSLTDEEIENSTWTKEQIYQFNALAQTLHTGATTVKDYEVTLARLSGRELIFQSIANAIKYVGEVLAPVKEAFKNIFPPATSEGLYNILEAIHTFTENLSISEEAVNNIRRTFEGFFAIFDIVGMAIGAFVSEFSRLLPVFGEAGGGFLGITGNIGDFIVGIRNAIKEGELFNKLFGFMVDAILYAIGVIKDLATSIGNSDLFKTIIQGAKDAATAIKDFVLTIPIGDWLSTFVSFAKSGIDKIKEAFGSLKDTTWFQAITDVVSAAADKIKIGLENIKNSFNGTGNIDLSGFKTFVENIKENFHPIETIATVITTVFGKIKSAFEKVIEFLSPVIEKIKEIFGKIKDSIVTTFEEKGFKGVLDLINTGVLAMILLGMKKFIDGITDIAENASGVLESIIGIFDGVRDCLKTYQDQLKANILMTIATAIGVLAAALVVLSLIDGEKLLGALGAITILFTELAGAMIILDKNIKSEKLKELAISLDAIAVAILILSMAVVKLADLNFEELAIGLSGVGILLIEIAGFSKMVNEAELTGLGAALVVVGAAILIMSSAVEKFGAIKTETLTKGITALGLVLAELGTFTKLVDGTKITGTATAMVVLGGAMLIMAKAVESFGSMSLETLAKGLGAMGIALGEMVLVFKLLPKNLMDDVVAIGAFSAAMLVLATALNSFGSMGWETMAQGLIAMAGSIAILLAAFAVSQYIQGMVETAAAFTLMAAAIMLLAPAMVLLGSMSLTEIGSALLTLAGAFTVIGVAGLVLGPIAPIIALLAASITLLGVGVLAIGGGLVLFATGLTALAAAGGLAIPILKLLIETMLELLPLAGQKIGEAIVAFATAIKDGMPAIKDAAVAALKALLEGFSESIELIANIGIDLILALLKGIKSKTHDIVDTAINIFKEFLKAIEENIQDIVDLGMKILLGFLRGIEENIQEVVDAGLGILVGILRGIEENIQDIIDAGYGILIGVIKGIADNVEEVIAAGTDLIGSFIVGIGNAIPDLIDAAAQAIIDMLDGMGETLEKRMPELVEAFFNLGVSIIDGLAASFAEGSEGLKNILLAFERLGEAIMDSILTFFGIKSPSTKFYEIGENLIAGLGNAIADGIQWVVGKATELANSVVNKVKEIWGNITEIGSNFVQGLGAGISGAVSWVTNAASNIANAVVNTVQGNWDSHSPSRVGIWLGKMFDLGLAEGLLGTAEYVANSAVVVGEKTLTAMSRTLDKVSEVIDDQIEANPTITPVIDLDEIKKGAISLQNMLSVGKSIAIELSSTISASRSKTTASEEGQNASDSKEASIENKFEIYGLVVREEADIDRIASRLYQKQQQSMRGKGIKV